MLIISYWTNKPVAICADFQIPINEYILLSLGFYKSQIRVVIAIILYIFLKLFCPVWTMRV